LARKKHKDKIIEQALQYAESHGWSVEASGNSAHAWGRLKCPYNDKNCNEGKYCLVSIWSTPRNSYNHAKQIKKIVDRCVRNKGEDDE